MEIFERMKIVQKDITRFKVDAIVNAANMSLRGGGGVDGAIHLAAGPELDAECQSLDRCPTGEARVTGAYLLPADWVIHAVGPVWHGGKQNEARLLGDCYRNSLRLAVEKGAHTISFPSISTGAYRYPIEEASRIALSTVAEFLQSNDSIRTVYFVCFNPSDYMCYKRTFRDLKMQF